MCKFQENLKFWRDRRNGQKYGENDEQKDGPKDGQTDRQTLIYRNLLAMAGGPIKHLPTFATD